MRSARLMATSSSSLALLAGLLILLAHGPAQARDATEIERQAKMPMASSGT